MTIFKRTSLPHLLSILLCCLALPTQAETLEFKNGDRLIGDILSMTPNSLTLSCPLANAPLEIYPSAIRKITFPVPSDLPNAHTQRLTLTNGDTFPCKILSLDNKELHITTWYAGNFTIPRQHIQALQFGISEEKTLFLASGQPNQWDVQKGKWSWSQKNSSFSCSGLGTLAQEVELPDNIQFSFTLAWRETPKCIFRFCAENSTPNKNQNTYELQFNSAGLRILRFTNDIKTPETITSIPLKPHNVKKESLDIKIQLNRKKGELTLYIDDIHLSTSPIQHPKTEGKFIVFNNRTKAKKACTIKNFKITTLHDATAMLPPNKDALKSDLLLDSEGEELSGEITSITTEGGKQTIHFSHLKSPLHIPARRIAALLFATHKKQPLPTSTYVSTLRQHGSFHAQSITLDQNSLICEHPLLGKFTLDPKALQSLTHQEKEDDSSPKKATDKASITFTTGNHLSGFPDEMDEDNNLHFTSSLLRKPSSFPTKNIRSITFHSWKKHPLPQTLARVRLQHRFIGESTSDTLLGELKELTPESIKLNTWYGGIITIRRSMVKSLRIINSGPGNYFGPSSLAEWTLESEDSWKLENSALHAVAAGAIGRDMKLHNLSHISFDAAWPNSLRFKCLFFASDPGSNPDAYYQLLINSYSISLTTRGKTPQQGGFMRGGGQRQNIRIPPNQNKAHFDFFIDRQKGSITCQLDGKVVGTLFSSIQAPENLGTFLNFKAENACPISISNLIVTPWNGIQKPRSLDPILPPDIKKSSPISPHKIILTNGDEIPGTIGKVIDGKMMIETEFATIRVPINKILTLSLDDKGEQPIMNPGDVRAWFHTGGFIILQPHSLKDGVITGYNQALGNVTLKLEAFRKIDFHIYQ